MFSVMNSVGGNAANPTNINIGAGDGRYDSGELNGRSLAKTPCTRKCTTNNLDDEKSRSLAQRECVHQGESPLLIGDHQRRTEYLQMLNEAGEDISNVVTTAFQRGETELLILLKCLKSMRLSQTTLDNALCAAAKQGQIPCLDILRTAGAKDLDGALYAAARAKNKEAQNALVLLGVNVSSLIHSAVRDDNLECLSDDVILHQINATDEKGRTALHIAIKNGYTKSLEKLLETSGVDINIADKYGCTPLHSAVKYACAEKDPDKIEIANALRLSLVESLLGVKSINVNEKTQVGSTALHLAVKYADVKTFELLLKADINVNAKDTNHYTALHLAVEYGLEDFTELLLGVEGIQVNETSHKYFVDMPFGVLVKETPLHIAVRKGDTEIVELLLGFEGIDVYVKNHQGDTALRCAGFDKDCRQLFKNFLKRK